MIFRYLLKNKKVLLPVIALVSLIAVIFLSIYSPIIFQEGDPLPQIKGIIQLTFGKSDMVKLSGSDNKYLTESGGGWEIMDNYLKERGYEFVEQMGSGYFYESFDDNIVLVRRQYSRFYAIWTFSEK